MAKLTDDVKRFIVEQIACYRTPSQVAADVKAAFNLVVDRRQVEEYDPAKSRTKPGRGTTPAKKWCEIYEATRARFLAECGQQPIADQRIRMRELQRIFELEEERQNTVGQRQTLEQAAKEAGGAFTNKRVLSGSIAVTIEDVIRAAADDTDDTASADGTAATTDAPDDHGHGNATG